MKGDKVTGLNRDAETIAIENIKKSICCRLPSFHLNKLIAYIFNLPLFPFRMSSSNTKSRSWARSRPTSSPWPRPRTRTSSWRWSTSHWSSRGSPGRGRRRRPSSSWSTSAQSLPTSPPGCNNKSWKRTRSSRHSVRKHKHVGTFFLNEPFLL